MRAQTPILERNSGLYVFENTDYSIASSVGYSQISPGLPLPTFPDRDFLRFAQEIGTAWDHIGLEERKAAKLPSAFTVRGLAEFNIFSLAWRDRIGRKQGDDAYSLGYLVAKGLRTERSLLLYMVLTHLRDQTAPLDNVQAILTKIGISPGSVSFSGTSVSYTSTQGNPSTIANLDSECAVTEKALNNTLATLAKCLCYGFNPLL